MITQMQKYLDSQKKKSEVTSRLLEIKALEETPELRAERETLTKKQGEVEIAFRKALAEVRGRGRADRDHLRCGRTGASTADRAGVRG